MCQAYEDERSLCCAIEDADTRRGFEDYLNHSPYDTASRSLHFSGGAGVNYYQHGWNCAKEGLLPYGIEKDLNLHKYGSVFKCPACGAEVSRYSRKRDGTTHDFGFPCDGSNPLEHQRRGYRHQEYLRLKAEFEA